MKPSIDDIYTKFGKTAEVAQTLELEASNAILSFIVLFMITDKTTNEEKIKLQKLSEKNDKKTLGNLLGQIKKVVEFNPLAETNIETALEKRNYLIHDFYKKHNFAIHSEEGREQMIADLDDISKTLEIGCNQLCSISKLLTKLDGREDVSVEAMNKLIETGKTINI